MPRRINALLLAAVCLAGCAASMQFVPQFQISGVPAKFAPGVISTDYSEIRLAISPDGRTALWFSRNRPGGPGGYDIWMSRRAANNWLAPTPVSFNSPTRDFDPAFSADGRFVYFSSDRPGGNGGDDVWRVSIGPLGFGSPENLGSAVNSPGNEWAPMLSGDGRTLLFSSNGHPGARRMDLFTSRVVNGHFGPAASLPGDINGAGDDFDATFLANGTTVVFSRAPDLTRDKVKLYVSQLRDGVYGQGTALPDGINKPNDDSYAPLLDWSQRDRFTFTRSGDVYIVTYEE